MASEYIVELEDGELYHLTESHPLFKRKLVFIKLEGNTQDLKPDYQKVIMVVPKWYNSKDDKVISGRVEPGGELLVEDSESKTKTTPRIYKVFKRAA